MHLLPLDPKPVRAQSLDIRTVTLGVLLCSWRPLMAVVVYWCESRGWWKSVAEPATNLRCGEVKTPIKSNEKLNHKCM
jgi:hypothetical protein